MSENNETLLLIEVYKEQTASWKHEDNILYKFGAVMLPVSFAALGVPYIADVEESNLIILEIMSTIGGMILMTFWVAYVHASHAKINARFQIINKIERDWGIRGHKDIPCIRNKAFKPPPPLQFKTYFLETRIFDVYWIAAFILTIYRFCDKLHSCKSFAIASLLPILVIICCARIAEEYECSIKQGEKHLRYSTRS